MIDTLKRIEALYNCDVYETVLGEQKFLELKTLNALTSSNLAHIRFVFKQYGYYFYKIEAIDDYLIITYYKK